MSAIEMFVLGALAVWRVTHLVHAEDGPGSVLVRLRSGFGSAWVRSLFECFYCLSLWVALPFAALIGSSLGERTLMWLALSGAACLLERFSSQAHEPARPVYWEEKENDDGMLRREPNESESPRQSH